MTTVLLAFLGVLVLAVFVWGVSRRGSSGRNIRTVGDYTPDRADSRHHDYDSGGSSFLTGFMLANALSPPGRKPEGAHADDPHADQGDADHDATDPGGADFGAEFGASSDGGGGDFGGGDCGGGDGGGGGD